MYLQESKRSKKDKEVCSDKYLEVQNLLHRPTIWNALRKHGHDYVYSKPLTCSNLTANLQGQLHWNEVIGTCFPQPTKHISIIDARYVLAQNGQRKPQGYT